MENRHKLWIAAMVVVAMAAALTLIPIPGWDSLAQGDTIYVDAGAGGANDGTSWTDAYTDLQDALDAAVAPAEIWVARGTYKPTDGTVRTISFQMKTDVAIYGGFAGTETELGQRDWVANPTILSGDLNGDDGPDFANRDDNSYHVFYNSGVLDSTAILDGFTITGGNANGSDPHNRGGGMRNSDGASPTLTNCTFTDNSTVWDGGGMYNYYSSPTLTRCTFSANSAVWGAGMYNVDSSPTMTDCTFSGNSADAGGGAVLTGGSSSAPVFTNCTFSGNHTDGTGGAMRNAVGGSSVVTNCTFFGNSADDGSGMYNEGSSVEVTNCILWGGSGSQISDGPDATVTVSFSDIQGGYSGTGNIDLDPLLADPDNGDYHLGPGSPCIDDGDNDAPNLPEYDFEGDPRVADGDHDGTATVDMGVDEVYEAPPPVIFVDHEAGGANNGTSWDDALTDLQAALVWAVDGIEIWVAAGTYKPTSGTERWASFQMKNGVAIYGGFDPTAGDIAWGDRDWTANATILSGDLLGDDGPEFANSDDNSYHVFYHPAGTNLNGTAILDGFTVTGGNADADLFLSGGGMYNDGSSPTLTNCTFSDNSALSGNGGGMYNYFSSPELTNCTFTGNSASSGGGMLNSSSSPTLTNCTFEGNSAFYGGGMHNARSSSPTLTGCTFAGNSAIYWGGGMQVEDSSPELTNCTFSGNSADYGGGIYNWESWSTVTNCILWGDDSPEISNVGSGTPDVTYSDIQGGYPDPGGTNIDADPHFLDPDNGDFHLGPGSPCIDAGTNDAPYLPHYDFEGDPRIIDGNGDGDPIVDMGVDEAWARVYLPLVLKAY